jgi:replicative DNA helicase
MPSLHDPRFDLLINDDAPERDVSGLSIEQVVQDKYADEVAKQVMLLRARDEAKRQYEAEHLENMAESGSGTAERLLAGGDGILDQPDLPEAVWGDGARIAWAEGQGTMVAAPQGVGKSTLAQNLIFRRIGVITEPLVGMPVKVSDAKVLYLAMDRPLQALQSMKRMVSEKDRQRLNERLVVWKGPLPFSLLADPLRLAEWVQEVAPGCQTVVIDSVKDLASGISSDEPGAAINTAWQELIANGVEVLALHHQRKGQQGGDKRTASLDEVYGSTWLTSGMGSVFTIDGETGSSVVTIKQLKSVVEMIDDTPVRIDMETGLMHLHDPNSMSLSEVLTEAGWHGISAKDAARKVYGADSQAEVRKMKRELSKMVEVMTVVKMDKAPGASGKTPDKWRLINPTNGQAMTATGLAGMAEMAEIF